MRFHPKIIAAATLLMLVSPALAGHHHFAPVPAAGAGLGFAAIAGGYYALRHWLGRKAK